MEPSLWFSLATSPCKCLFIDSNVQGTTSPFDFNINDDLYRNSNSTDVVGETVIYCIFSGGLIYLFQSP